MTARGQKRALTCAVLTAAADDAVSHIAIQRGSEIVPDGFERRPLRRCRLARPHNSAENVSQGVHKRVELILGAASLCEPGDAETVHEQACDCAGPGKPSPAAPTGRQV